MVLEKAGIFLSFPIYGEIVEQIGFSKLGWVTSLGEAKPWIHASSTPIKIVFVPYSSRYGNVR